MMRCSFPIFAAAVLALTFCGPRYVVAQDASLQDGNLPPSLNPMTAVKRTTLKAFLERPLFNPARRLPPPAASVSLAPSPVAPPSVPPPNLQLLGVIHGLRDMAIVRRGGDDKTLILHAGDDLSGWKVSILPPIGIRLQNGSRRSDYVLFGKGGTVRPADDDPTSNVRQPSEVSDEMEVGNARPRR